MKKIIRLTESDLTKLIKRIISETTMAPEPVITSKQAVKIFYIKDGDYKLTDYVKGKLKMFLEPKINTSLPTLQKFYKNKNTPLPKFITIGAGTSSTGDPSVNEKVANYRINEIYNFVKGLLKEKGLNDEIIKRILTTNTNYNYEPTNVDANFYDRGALPSKQSERYAFVEISALNTLGNTESGIDDIEDRLKYSRGLNIDPNEEGIVNAIKELETYTDIIDLDNELRGYGGLEDFINQTITSGLTTWGDDSQERNQIVNYINKAARNSGKGSIAKVVGDMISIILE